MSQHSTASSSLAGCTESTAPLTSSPSNPMGPAGNDGSDKLAAVRQQSGHGVAVKNAKSWSHMVAGG